MSECKWTPTEDGFYSDSRNAMYRYGKCFNRLQVEKRGRKWHAMAYVRSKPRDEKGNFSFDLWPDDDGVRYTQASTDTMFTSKEEAIYHLEVVVDCPNAYMQWLFG